MTYIDRDPRGIDYPKFIKAELSGRKPIAVSNTFVLRMESYRTDGTRNRLFVAAPVGVEILREEFIAGWTPPDEPDPNRISILRLMIKQGEKERPVYIGGEYKISFECVTPSQACITVASTASTELSITLLPEETDISAYMRSPARRMLSVNS